jgi:hypothetical protein
MLEKDEVISVSSLFRRRGVKTKLHRLKNSTSRFRGRVPIPKTVQNTAENSFKLHGGENNLFVVRRLIYVDTM